MRAARATSNVAPIQLECPVMGELVDSAPLLITCEFGALRDRLARDGYIYLKAALERGAVRTAGRSVEQFLAANQLNLDGRGITLTGLEAVTHSVPMLDVLEGAALRRIFDALFDERGKTLSTKWARVVGAGEQTSVHSDAFFFDAAAEPSSPSASMLVCWTPLDDCPRDSGPLALAVGSHLLDGFHNGGGGGCELPSGFEVATAEWRTASFSAGDALIFHIRCVHGSLPNRTSTRRISVDTRWYPASVEIGSGRGGK